MENKLKKIPKISDLYKYNGEIDYQELDELKVLLNQNPKQEWVKFHPFIKNYKYIPIGIIEWLLHMIFKKYSIEILREGTSFNGVFVVVRVHYLHPTTGTMEFHDGVGACQLQTKQGTSPSDLININNGAIAMAYPIAKTTAIKDACDHFGKLFGSDLNRKDFLEIVADASIKPNSLKVIQNEDEYILSNIKKVQDLKYLQEINPNIDSKLYEAKLYELQLKEQSQKQYAV